MINSISKLSINSILRKITKYKEALIGGGYDFSKPEEVQIETTIRCNLRCTMCDDEMKQRVDKKDIDFDNFIKIIKQFKKLKSINFTGYGEPLLNGDLLKMVKYASEKGISTSFSTNCTLLNSQNTERILNSGLKSLIFSIDSGIEEEYNKIRIGSNFQIVKENIKNFMNQHRESGSDIRVEIYSVVIPPRIKEIEKILDFAKETGVKKVKIRGLVDHRGRNDKYDINALYHPENREMSEKYLKEAREYAEKIGVIFSYPPLSPVSGYKCRMPSERPFISVEGDITPCCVQGMDPRNVNFGNLYKDSLKNIWNNKDYREFRRMLYTDTPSPMCVFCPRHDGMA